MGQSGAGDLGLWRAAILAAVVSVQAGFLLTTMTGNRPIAPLGGPRLLARVVSMQVLLGAIFGEHWMHRYVTWRIWQNNTMPISVFLAGISLSGFAWRRGSPLLRKGCVFGGLVL